MIEYPGRPSMTRKRGSQRYTTRSAYARLLAENSLLGQEPRLCMHGDMFCPRDHKRSGAEMDAAWKD